MRHELQPSDESVNLAIASIIIFGALFLPTLYIAYEHGKRGRQCWPILISFFLIRLISDAYFVSRRKEPESSTPVAIVGSAGSTATQSLASIGLIYES